ncbi:MAG: CCA tRNA nucleotidyltransferase [Acidimicrobiales bacterium]
MAAVPSRFEPLVEATSSVARLFGDAGHELHLVGGPVRDGLLGLDPIASPDLDYATDATPEQVLGLVKGWADALWTQGQRFGTIGFLHGGVRHEVTTYRAEAYSPDSRNPDVVFATDIEADLSRRDFTINAMALRLNADKGEEGLTLVDPFGGLDDLFARRLRTPLDPDISFSDDPLRMLRAARFMARFVLEPDPALVESATRLHERLSIISPERIRDELDRLMVADPPGLSRGLWFLVNTGLAEEFLPELPAMALEQDPIHRHKDVLAHTIAVVDKTSPDRILRLAALLHDIGKPKTRAIGPKGISFHHHEVVGARMARDRLRALKYPNDEIEAITGLVNLHLRFHTYKLGWTDAAVRRYVRDAGPLLGRLNELTRCDCTTRNPRRAAELSKRMDDLEVRIAQLEEQEQVKAMRPDLDGVAVMKVLDLPPGPEVGQAMRFLLDLRLEEGPLGEEESARRLEQWWANRPA